MPNPFRRENYLLLVLACAEAALLLDRLAVGFLAPFFTPDLHLSNFQLGLLSSLFSLSFALSGYWVSAAAKRVKNRLVLLAGLVLIFSMISALCALSTGFYSFALVRILLGIAEGPFLPIALSLMADESTASRRSFNLGFVQNVGAFLLAQLLGPIVLVAFSIAHGWRAAFAFTAVPGLVLAALLLILARSAHAAGPGENSTKGAHEPTWRPCKRNLWLCVAIAACMGSWILLQMTFMPKYLVQVAGMSPEKMSFMMSLLGLGGCASSLLLPALSDRIGRRPAIMIGIGFAILTPISVLTLGHLPALMPIGIVLGSLAFGCTPLYVAVIPREAVAREDASKAIALVSASSAIMGGVVAPALAGKLADGFGLGVIFWIAGGLAIVALGIASQLARAEGIAVGDQCSGKYSGAVKRSDPTHSENIAPAPEGTP